jgi:hypothetical protein
LLDIHKKTPNEGASIIKLTNNVFRLYAQVKMSVDARTLKEIYKYIFIFRRYIKKDKIQEIYES